MRTAREIFLGVGVPIVHASRDFGPNNYRGFRAFNEHDIAAIQAEAHAAGMEKARVAARDCANAAKRIIEKVGTTGIETGSVCLEAQKWLDKLDADREAHNREWLMDRGMEP